MPSDTVYKDFSDLKIDTGTIIWMDYCYLTADFPHMPLSEKTFNAQSTKFLWKKEWDKEPFIKCTRPFKSAILSLAFPA